MGVPLSSMPSKVKIWRRGIQTTKYVYRYIVCFLSLQVRHLYLSSNPRSIHSLVPLLLSVQYYYFLSPLTNYVQHHLSSWCLDPFLLLRCITARQSLTHFKCLYLCIFFKAAYSVYSTEKGLWKIEIYSTVPEMSALLQPERLFPSTASPATGSNTEIFWSSSHIHTMFPANPF
jgi:hypothetical protein